MGSNVISPANINFFIVMICSFRILSAKIQKKIDIQIDKGGKNTIFNTKKSLFYEIPFKE